MGHRIILITHMVNQIPHGPYVSYTSAPCFGEVHPYRAFFPSTVGTLGQWYWSPQHHRGPMIAVLTLDSLIPNLAHYS